MLVETAVCRTRWAGSLVIILSPMKMTFCSKFAHQQQESALTWSDFRMLIGINSRPLPSRLTFLVLGLALLVSAVQVNVLLPLI